MVKLICEKCTSDNVFDIKANKKLGYGHYTHFVCNDCGHEFPFDDADIKTIYDDEM